MLKTEFLSFFLHFCAPFVPSVLPSLGGVTCAALITAAACQHTCQQLYTSSACGALPPPPTIVSHHPATATRWWSVLAGNQGRDWDQRGTGGISQCPLFWSGTRKGWDLERGQKPESLTLKPGTKMQSSHHPRRKSREEGRHRERRGGRSKKTGTGKEIFDVPFIKNELFYFFLQRISQYLSLWCK